VARRVLQVQGVLDALQQAATPPKEAIAVSAAAPPSQLTNSIICTAVDVETCIMVAAGPIASSNAPYEQTRLPPSTHTYS
jgi:uridine phosphorylase